MAEPRPAPRSLTELYGAFTLLALQGFGGVLAVAERELVEKRRWLSAEEFLEEWAIAQIMPGPNVVNLSLIVGAHHFGWRGALAALAGMLSLPLCIALLLAWVYGHYASLAWVTGAMHGIAAVTAGLIAGTALRMRGALDTHPVGRALAHLLAGLTAVAVAVWRLPLFLVLPLLGGLAWWLTYRKLRP